MRMVNFCTRNLDTGLDFSSEPIGGEEVQKKLPRKQEMQDHRKKDHTAT